MSPGPHPTPPSSPGWHVSPNQVSAYLDDLVDAPTAASIEAHVLTCGLCRSVLSAKSDAATTATSWAALERRIDAEVTAPIERLAGLVGFSERDARMLVPTRALQLSWLLAMTAALICAAWLARQSGDLGATRTRLFFLTVAPLAPLVAVVSALSTASEPAPDIARATAASRLRIGALRAVTVMLGSMVIGMAASALLPGAWIGGVVWLSPALALCALGSVLASKLQSNEVLGLLGGGWVAIVLLAAYLTEDRLAAFQTGPQFGYLAIAATSVVAIALRPTSFDFRRLS